MPAKRKKKVYPRKVAANAEASQKKRSGQAKRDMERSEWGYLNEEYKVRRKTNLSLIHYKDVRLLMERVDRKGNRVPFYLEYCTKTGVVEKHEGVICTSVEPKYHRRRVMFRSGVSRTIRDVLVLRVDDTRVIVS